MNIRLAETKEDLKKFIQFPHKLYKNDSHYAPELNISVAEKLSAKTNPYFLHSTATYYLLENEVGEVFGRIALTVNNNYNQFHQTNVAWFGFFDCVDDSQCSQKLFEAAFDFCKSKGVSTLLGPASFTTNDSAALLVEGFDAPPLIQMAYNFPYYEKLLLQAGFKPEMNLGAYYIATKDVNVRSLGLEERLESRLKLKGIHIRNIRKKDWKNEVARVRSIYKLAWQNNWGFVPPTDEEFDFLANELKMVVDDRFAFLAEKDGKAIGFLLAIPDINEIMVHNKKGKLVPSILFQLLFRKRKIKNLRVILLGVLEEYRQLGIEGVFFARIIRQAQNEGIRGGEASWILENNKEMCASAEKLNGVKYKNYRIYERHF